MDFKIAITQLVAFTFLIQNQVADLHQKVQSQRSLVDNGMTGTHYVIHL